MVCCFIHNVPTLILWYSKLYECWIEMRCPSSELPLLLLWDSIGPCSFLAFMLLLVLTFVIMLKLMLMFVLMHIAYGILFAWEQTTFSGVNNLIRSIRFSFIGVVICSLSNRAPNQFWMQHRIHFSLLSFSYFPSMYIFHAFFPSFLLFIGFFSVRNFNEQILSLHRILQVNREI